MLILTYFVILTPLFSEGLAHSNQFVQKEYCSENLDFWVAVNEFREKNPQGDRLKRAVNNIFDTYIKTTAERQVFNPIQTPEKMPVLH